MANMSTIVKVNQKFVWPSWVVYDQNFRQEVANMLGMTWAKVNPSIYLQYFISMAANTEGWCKQCQSIKHPSDRCPDAPPLDPVPHQGQSRGASVCKRPWPVLPSPSPKRATLSGPSDFCIMFNRFHGECKFGKSCRFPHVCSQCRGLSCQGIREEQ